MGVIWSVREPVQSKQHDPGSGNAYLGGFPSCTACHLQPYLQSTPTELEYNISLMPTTGCSWNHLRYNTNHEIQSLNSVLAGYQYCNLSIEYKLKHVMQSYFNIDTVYFEHNLRLNIRKACQIPLYNILQVKFCNCINNVYRSWIIIQGVQNY